MTSHAYCFAAILCLLTLGGQPARARSIVPLPDLHLAVRAQATSAKIFVYKMVKGKRARVLAATLPGGAGAKRALSHIGISKQPMYKCGYHGAIVFFKGASMLVEVEFNTDARCAHASYLLSNKLGSLNLTTQGLAYLRSLVTKP